MNFPELTPLIQNDNVKKYQVYKKRWFILFIFCLFVTSSMTSATEYVSVAEAMVNYYNTTPVNIDWSSIIMQVIYLPVLLPSTYAVYKLGLRKSVLWGLTLTSCGNGIKLLGVAPDKYWAVLLGQSFIAVPQALILPLCAQVAATWFADNEVATACGIGILTISFSLGLGLLLPPLIIKPQNNVLIGEGLYAISIGYTIFPIVVLLLAYFCFPDAPPNPPSMAQLKIQDNTIPTRNYLQSLKELLGNTSILVLLISYGINTGLFYAFTTLLNQLLLKHHKHATTDVGIIGFLMNFVGAWGSLIAGIVLDKFRQYKATFWVVNFVSFGSTLAAFLLINEAMYVVYLTAILYGLCANAILSVTIELGVELTYPVPQNIMTGLLNLTCQVFNVCMTFSYSYLMNAFNEATAHVALVCIQTFSLFLIYFIKYDLKRQTALRDR